MRTWNDISIGTPIYLLLVTEKGFARHERRKCINIESNQHYTLFTYEKVEHDYVTESDDSNATIGILSNNLANHKHTTNIKNVDAQIFFYSDLNKMIEDVKSQIKRNESEIINLTNENIHYNELIDKINI